MNINGRVIRQKIKLLIEYLLFSQIEYLKLRFKYNYLGIGELHQQSEQKELTCIHEENIYSPLGDSRKHM